MLNLRIFIPFHPSLKSLPFILIIICNLTHLHERYTKVKFMLRIVKNSCRIRIRVQNQLKSKIRIRVRIKKNHSGSKTLTTPIILKGSTDNKLTQVRR
jgi:hypothetical protein